MTLLSWLHLLRKTQVGFITHLILPHLWGKSLINKDLRGYHSSPHIICVTLCWLGKSTLMLELQSPFLEKHGIICHVFMGISTRCPLPQHSFSLELSSLSKLNSVDSTDVPRDVFAQVTVQWYWVVYSLLSAMPPPSSLLLAFISLHGFGSDVLFPAFSQERERGGERERKGGPFKRGMTDALLKEAGPFESLAPPCSPPTPPPHVSGPIVTGRWQQPPHRALCHCKSPRRLKRTHSEKTHPFATVTLHYSGILPGLRKKLIVWLSQNIQETQRWAWHAGKQGQEKGGIKLGWHRVLGCNKCERWRGQKRWTAEQSVMEDRKRARNGWGTWEK